MKKIVLAFSGGLDTSFCVPYLIDQGFEDMLVDNNVEFDPVDLSTFMSKYNVEEDLEIIKHEDKEISVLIDFESWCSWNKEMQEFWLSAL